MSFSKICITQGLLAQAATGQPDAGGYEVLWAVILLAVALVLLIVEVFVPSGGIVGLFAAVALVAGIVMMFRVNTTLGLISAIFVLIALPFVLGFVLKLWPHTPIGRRLVLANPVRPLNKLEDQSSSMAASDPQALVGQRGKAITDLHPVGTCLIQDQRRECLADGQIIRAGSTVQVISADGMQIKVRPDDQT